MISLTQTEKYLGRRVRSETGEFLGCVRQVQSGGHPENFWLFISPTSISWIPIKLSGLYQMNGNEIIRFEQCELIVEADARYRLTPIIQRWWNSGKKNPPWNPLEDLPYSVNSQLYDACSRFEESLSEPSGEPKRLSQKYG